MTPQIAIVTAVAAASVAFIGYLAYKLIDPCRRSSPLEVSLEDNSSLDEDLKDILAFVPLKEVQQIVETYMKHDPQIGDTVSFINDQKRFILREFQKMPECTKLIDFLRRGRLDVDGIYDRVRYFWKTSPRFVKCDPALANGGLTVMISNILRTIPMDELHETLKLKAKYSMRFHQLLRMLRSQEYQDFCTAMEKNDVLHHHYFWAKEGGLEITFAIELYNELFTYLTQVVAR